MTFNILLHFPRTNLIGLFPRGRFYPSSTTVFTFMCARHYFWTFGVLCIFGVFNNQLYYSTNLCFIDLIVVALWNRPQVDAVCPASRDPNQASCPSIPTCECFKALKINIKKIRFDWSRVYSETFGEREQGTVSLGQRNI